MPSAYQIRECENPDCRLRFPLVEGQESGIRCPACLGATRLVLSRNLPAAPEADTAPGRSPSPQTPLPVGGRPPGLEALLDNIRSAWNVGAIFRTADGLGVRRLHLCGITPTPENESVRKTALGAEETVHWTHAPNALETARELKAAGHALIALEQDPRANPVGQISRDSIPEGGNLSNAILVLGNEITGVDPELLDLCDQIVYVPMRGGKRSLNVAVAFGIAGFTLSFALS